MTAAGGAVDAGGSGYLDVSGPYRLARPSFVAKLRGLVSGETRPMSVRVVVYADRKGHPGPLVAATREVRIAAGARRGWVTFPLHVRARLAPGRYWLGYWYGPGAGSGSGGFRYLAARGAEAYARAPYHTAGPAPRRFPAPATASSRYALYAVTTPAPRKESRP